MNIWLDSTSYFQHPSTDASRCRNDDCPTDCVEGPAYIGLSPPIIPTLSEEDIQHLYLHTFVRSQTLYVQQFGESRWLVCNPTDQGKVAVMDAETYALLACFHSPKTLLDVLEGEPIYPSGVAKAISLFTDLGFLQDLNQPTPISEQEPPYSLSAWLHVTNACNLGCHYCYVNKTTEHMADETAIRAVDALIRSATRYHYQHIHLTCAGGEATLRLPQVITTYDYALQQTREHGLSLSANIISNGAALPLRAIEQLKQRQIGIGISLDGIGESQDQQRPLVNGQGSFAFVDKTITRLLSSGLVPSINVTVTRRNLAELPSLLEYILQRNLPFGLSYYRDNDYSTHLQDLQFTDGQMIDGMRTAFAFIEQHLPRKPLLGSLVDKANTRAPHQYACGVGRNYLVIDQRGGIAKCQVDIANTITTVDAENPLQMIRADRRGLQAVAADEKEGCRSCEWRYWCSGGCPMLTYRLTGRSDIKSPNCSIYKALFPEALRLEGLRLLKYETPIVL